MNHTEQVVLFNKTNRTNLINGCQPKVEKWLDGHLTRSGWVPPLKKLSEKDNSTKLFYAIPLNPEKNIRTYKC